jgi:hypothetical protein
VCFGCWPALMQACKFCSIWTSSTLKRRGDFLDFLDIIRLLCNLKCELQRNGYSCIVLFFFSIASYLCWVPNYKFNTLRISVSIVTIVGLPTMCEKRVPSEINKLRYFPPNVCLHNVVRCLVVLQSCFICALFNERPFFVWFMPVVLYSIVY